MAETRKPCAIGKIIVRTPVTLQYLNQHVRTAEGYDALIESTSRRESRRS